MTLLMIFLALVVWPLSAYWLARALAVIWEEQE